MLKLDARGKRVLFISDTHIPYSVQGYLEFLSDLKDRFRPEIVIHIGDEIDYHAISFHDSISELFSAGHELDKSIIEVQEGLHRLFPKMYLLESNHGSLIFRKLKHHGVPIRVIRPLPDLYETPLWSWHEHILLRTDRGKVYCCHGKSGAYGRMVKELGTSVVQGHFHTKFEITYHRSILGNRFSMYVGCLADRESMAMSYARNNLPDFINGTGGIKSTGEPVLFPFRVPKLPPIPKEATDDKVQGR